MKLNDIFTIDKYAEYYNFAIENGFMIEEIDPNGEDRQFKVVPIVTKELTYAEKRALEYPTIQDQLDMIYWDSVNGTSLWMEKIAEIKEKYPKES